MKILNSEMLSDKETFEAAQRKREEDRREFEECRDEDIERDNLDTEELIED